MRFPSHVDCFAARRTRTRINALLGVPEFVVDMVVELLVGYRVAGLVVERDTSVWSLRRSRVGLFLADRV